uniref:Taste receptor type 2 n=1 Tax=Xenopus tropicalis TaxID=8364 RepID=Q2AB53_XENTR|nr:bitter taste receptor 32 [Xenopus tropicalis]BAE80414.1 bitter taste receptor [Xenopus tropicalis]
MDGVTNHSWNNYSTDRPADSVVVKDTTISPVLLIVISVAGMLTNVFILSVNFHSWIKGQSLNPSDLLLVTLAFSNLVLPVTAGVCTIYFGFISCGVINDYQFFVQTSIMVYVLLSNSWLSACLCFFCFVKVTNFKPGYLARLKSKINTLVPRLILGAQVFSILNSLFYMLTFFKVNNDNSTLLFLTNKASSTTNNRIDVFYNAFFLLVNCLIPFFIIVVTTSLIIASLYKHTRRMQRNVGEFGGPSLHIHHRAARTMISFLIIYLSFYVLSLGNSIFLNKHLLNWVNYMLGCAFSPTQSIVLIMGNSRLRQTCRNILKSCMKILSRETTISTVGT